MKPESCLSSASSEQGLASTVNLAGPLITSSPRRPWLSTPPLAGSLVAEVSSLCISSVCLITLDFPQPSALRALTKEVVGIHILLTRSFFGDNIPRRLLQPISLEKPNSAPLRF